MLKRILYAPAYIYNALLVGAVIILWFILPLLNIFPQISPTTKIEITLFVLLTYAALGLSHIQSLIKKPDLIITSSDAQWNNFLLSMISGAKARNAYFIDYAGSNAIPVMDHLIDSGWKVKVFIKNPETTDNGYQKKKISSMIERFKKLETNIDFEACMYNFPGSIRVRYIENVIVTVGWFTYDDNEIIGHKNIMISARPRSAEWKELITFVSEVIATMEKPINTAPL